MIATIDGNTLFLCLYKKGLPLFEGETFLRARSQGKDAGADAVNNAAAAAVFWLMFHHD
jgi:hypothetical protein